MQLKSFFQPRAVAIIGASSDPKKIGRQIFDNIINSGFTGAVYPVNLKGGQINGFKVITDLNDTPLKDRAELLVIIAIPADLVIKEVEKCAFLGIKNLIIISAGFKEAGPQGVKREQQIADLVAQYKLKILGPNCLGLINNIFKINASFAKNSTGSGNIALLSQSGAVGSAALDWLMSRHLNFGYFISLGNKSFLNENDFLQYLASDKKISAIVLYLEEISDGLKLIQLCSRLVPKKPVIILSSGLSGASQEIIKSHTGALAGSREVLIASWRRGGIIPAENLEDLFYLLQLFSSSHNLFQKIKKFKNKEINIVTNAGGLAALTADLADSRGIKIKNNLDILGDANDERYQQAINSLLKTDPQTSILVILTPQSKTNPQNVAKVIAKIAAKHKQKLLMTCFVGGTEIVSVNEWLNLQGVAAFSFPEMAIKMFNYLFIYKAMQDSLKPLVINSRNSGHQLKPLMPIYGTKLLDYLDSFRLLVNYKIPVVKTTRYSVLKKDTISTFPIVLKVTGVDFIHKTDTKAIFLNLQSIKDLEKQAIFCHKKYQKLLQNKNNYLIVQPQINSQLELIVGLKKDAVFGHVILVGLGGIYSEVFRQTSLSIAQLNKSQALTFIKELPFYPLLNGARNGYKYNLNKLADILMKLCDLATDYPNCRELDINPLFVTKKDFVAGDIRIFID